MILLMVERLRKHHVVSWTAVGVTAGVLVVACLVASLEIAIEASIGAGDEQRVFRYERKLALAFDVGWPGPLAGPDSGAPAPCLWSCPSIYPQEMSI